jgi:uncharacterized membrane protein
VDSNRGIGCNTIEGEVMISDEVRFGEACFEEATSGRTRVDVTMNYSDAPAGAAGEAVTNILPKPERNLKENLENLSRNIERGRLRRTRGADPQPLTSVPVMG